MTDGDEEVSQWIFEAARRTLSTFVKVSSEASEIDPLGCATALMDAAVGTVLSHAPVNGAKFIELRLKQAREGVDAVSAEELHALAEAMAAEFEADMRRAAGQVH